MIWDDLGYTRNIYFREPLPIDKLGRDLLAGRDLEIEDFLNACTNDNKFLKVVSGDVGIGKTSFVNACQFLCYSENYLNGSAKPKAKLLPSFKKIELSNHDSINSFSIKAIISLTTNINSHFLNEGKNIPSSIQEYIDYWTKIKLKTSSGGLSIGASLLGSGGHVDRQTNTFAANEMHDPLSAFENLLRLILGLTDISGIFMLIDNIDTVDSKNVIRILDEIRDSYFTLDDIYWILIGQKGLGEMISGRSRRLGGYLTGAEISLSKISSIMFLNAIQEREKAFRIANKADVKKFKNRRKKISNLLRKQKVPDYEIYPPLDEQTHKMIYEFAHFELREAFKICYDITVRAQEYITANGQLYLQDAFNYLVEYCDTIASYIDSFEDYKSILSKIYLKNEVNNSAYDDFGCNSASGFESILRKLKNSGFLIPKTVGVKKFYEVSWRLEAMALCDILKKECTKAAYDKHLGATSF